MNGYKCKMNNDIRSCIYWYTQIFVEKQKINTYEKCEFLRD